MDKLLLLTDGILIGICGTGLVTLETLLVLALKLQLFSLKLAGLLEACFGCSSLDLDSPYDKSLL